MKILFEHYEPKEVEQYIQNLRNDGVDLQVEEERDIGCGADWPFIEVIIASIGGLFFLGEKINKNLDAWILIGNKIKGLLEEDSLTIFVDKDAATALAISEIKNINEGEISKVDILISEDLGGVEIEPIYRDGREKESLSNMPYNFYLLVFQVNDEETKYVFSINSNGDIRYKDIFRGNVRDYKNVWGDKA